jgi:hypothetical protein
MEGTQHATRPCRAACLGGHILLCSTLFALLLLLLLASMQ